MLVWPMVLMTPAVALMLPAAGIGLPGGHIDPWLGLGLLVASQVLVGLLQGPLDIALFTVRQRRTDPAWMGRAFAVSMAFNFSGYPIGAALSGAFAGEALGVAIGIGIVACLGAALFAATLVPRVAPPDPAIALAAGR